MERGYPPPRDSYSSSSRGAPRGGGRGGSRSDRGEAEADTRNKQNFGPKSQFKETKSGNYSVITTQGLLKGKIVLHFLNSLLSFPP